MSPGPAARSAARAACPSCSDNAETPSFVVRLLQVSDLHYTLPQFDWVLDQATDFDAVVVAGDSLDLASPVALESQIVVVRTYLRRLAERATTVVCSGNHDLTARNHHREKHAPWVSELSGDGLVTDWDAVDIGDCRITVCPWWDGPQTRADVDAQLDTANAGAEHMRQIWIYHFPPDNAQVSWVGRRHIGDRDLNDWIDRHQPDLVLTGHIHDSPFKDGGSWLSRLGSACVINPGHAPGPIPAHAIVDTVSGAAEWWSPFARDNDQLWSAADGSVGQ
jgi:Icc-related predicted phosphoesterase